jgi:hypothetical protein
MMLVVASALLLVAALVLARFRGWESTAQRMESWDAPLRRYGPAIAAVVSVAVVWFTWDALVPIPKVHDENSYLLQADIFARGRWTVPSPPIAEFFEQPHVQVVPSVASKYPPGHALLLTLGAIVGFHALVPLALTGVTAALLFALTARLTNPWTASFAWLVWITAPIVLRFQPSYFSELTTSPLLLASWWLLLDWRESRRLRWLMCLALAIGWCAITRPLTALAFAVPIGVVVVRDALRLRLWRGLAMACALGIAVLAILPLWSAKTTGDWRLSPIELYRKDYLPFDKMGFTPDLSPPRRTVSPVLKTTYDYFLTPRKEQTLDALPRTMWDRGVQLTIALFEESRLPLLPLAVIGMLFASGPIRFGVASAGLALLAHLPYAHWAPWTVYYLETVPVFAAVTGIGLWKVARRVAATERRMRVSVALAFVVVAAFAVPTVQKWRMDHRTRSAFDRRFAQQISQLPSQPAIVFVQYTPRVAQHVSVVFTSANLGQAPVWVVHDLGSRNEKLRALAPDRASFDFDEDQLVRGLRRK